MILNYKSIYTGNQVDKAVGIALDAEPRLDTLETLSNYYGPKLIIRTDLNTLTNTIVSSTSIDGVTTKLLKSIDGGAHKIEIGNTSKIANNIEYFYLQLSKGISNHEISEKRYLIYYGGLGTNALVEEDLRYLNPGVVSELPNRLNISTLDDYIWLVIPRSLNISKVIHRGFDFPLENALVLSTSLGQFNCYRSTKILTESSWSLVIS